MSGDPIRPGATVRLRSGGPPMTVVKKIPASWECVWFAGDERRSATFVEPDLSAEPDDEAPIVLGPEDEAGPWNMLAIAVEFAAPDDLSRAIA